MEPLIGDGRADGRRLNREVLVKGVDRLDRLLPMMGVDHLRGAGLVRKRPIPLEPAVREEQGPLRCGGARRVQLDRANLSLLVAVLATVLAVAAGTAGVLV